MLVRFLLRARRAAGLRGTVNVLVTTSAAMHSLNLRFRGQNKPTDVLSFPSEPSGKGSNRARFAGELAISADIAMQNAARLGHSAALEVKVLTLHGVLHLAGFDHERDNGQMARKEAKLRMALRLPSALIERARKSESGRRGSSTARARRGRRTT
jgi:probable rRNA maturation factor